MTRFARPLVLVAVDRLKRLQPRAAAQPCPLQVSHAYGWAFANPVRKVYYNITVTALSVTVALGIGGIELLQLVVKAAWLDVNRLGYVIVAMFILTWGVSAVVWRARRIEERWSCLDNRGRA